jgi:hypothetical protein
MQLDTECTMQLEFDRCSCVHRSQRSQIPGNSTAMSLSGLAWVKMRPRSSSTDNAIHGTSSPQHVHYDKRFIRHGTDEAWLIIKYEHVVVNVLRILCLASVGTIE